MPHVLWGHNKADKVIGPWFMFRCGYDIGSDLPYGFTLKLGRIVFNLHWDYPKAIWFNQSWAVNERGYVQGMPIARKRKKLWLLRGFTRPQVNLRFRP